jgi:hypothetical protein
MISLQVAGEGDEARNKVAIRRMPQGLFNIAAATASAQ